MTRRNIVRLDRSVGEEHRDERRHVRLDHADTLGHADDASGAARNVCFCDLVHRVGRHDAACDGFCVRVTKDLGNRGQPGTYRIHRVLASDDSGRGDQHFVRLAVESGSNSRDDLARIGHAGRTGGDVGVLRDDDDSACATTSQVFARDHDARSGEATLGEHAGRTARGVCRDEGEVVGRVLDADVGDVRGEPPREFHAHEAGEK
jgi:hypothetical protein